MKVMHKIFRILIQEYYFYTHRTQIRYVLPRAVSCFIKSYHFRLVVLLRIRHLLPWPLWMTQHYIQRTFGVEISTKATIGQRLRLAHLPGIVIGSGSVIGDDCNMFQGVLLGQSHGRFPVIGNNVTLCAYSCVLGGVRIGDNVIVLANSVVTHDIPSNSIVAGTPARVIKAKGDIQV